jgi:hypothetical protein
MKYLTVILFLCAVLPAVDQEGVDFVVKLKDNTVFISKIDAQNLLLKTEYGEVTIPLNEIRYIRSSSAGFTVKTTKSSIEGRFKDGLGFKSRYGQLKVDWDHIQELVPGGKYIWSDQHVVGWWDMTPDDTLKVNGAEFVNFEGSTASKFDLTKGDTIEIAHRENLAVKSAITVEVRFRLGDISLTSQGGFINLVSKSKGHMSNQETTFRISVHPKSRKFNISTSAEEGGVVHTSPSAAVERDVWHYFAAVIDASAKKIEAYLDGKKLDTALSGTFGSDKIRNTEIPIILSHHNYYDVQKGTIWIDFVRVSNRARSGEEIMDLAQTGSIGGIVKPSTDKEYRTVIATKDGEMFICKLGKEVLEFESLFGKVMVDTGKVSKITLFEYRKEQIEKIHERARQLIEKLADYNPKVRIKAHEELLSMDWVVLPILNENKGHRDEEVKTRVKRLLEVLANRKYDVKKDLVSAAGKSVDLRGWVQGDFIKASTRYGDIVIGMERVTQMVFNPSIVQEQWNFTVTFSDGSKMGGRLGQDEIEFASESGNTKIALKQIVSIIMGRDEDIVSTLKGKQKGRVVQDEFELETPFGRIRVKKKDISQFTTG